jgi:hypothetical protein
MKEQRMREAGRTWKNALKASNIGVMAIASISDAEHVDDELELLDEEEEGVGDGDFRFLPVTLEACPLQDAPGRGPEARVFSA